MQRLSILSSSDIHLIYSEALNMLNFTGVIVYHDEALNILDRAGAKVERKSKRVFIPEELINEAVKKVPKQFKLYDRDKKECLTIGNSQTYFIPGASALKYLEDEDVRSPLTEDFIKFIKIVEMLESIHIQGTSLVPADVPSILADRYRLYLVLNYARKPIGTGTFTIDGTADMIRMLAIVRDGYEELAKHPYAFFVCCSSPPFKWSDITMESLIECSKHNVPVSILPMPMIGLTSPGTVAAAILQHVAEFLSGLVISQLVNPGAPVLLGGSPGAIEPKTGSNLLGAPEVLLVTLGYNDVAKWLGIPSHAFLGVSDSLTVDMQATLESSYQLILGALAGINIIHGPGMLESEITQSLEKLILDNEICKIALRLVRGIEVSRETLALELFTSTGPGAEYIKNISVLKFMMKWIPREILLTSPALNRCTRSTWKLKGGRKISQRIKELINEKLNSYSIEPLPKDKLSMINEVMLHASKKHRANIKLITI